LAARADVGVLAGSGSSCVESIGGVTVDDTPPGTTPEMVMFASTVCASHVGDEGDRGRAAPSAKVAFVSGDDVQEAASLAAASDVAIVFVWQTRTEGQDLQNLFAAGRSGRADPESGGRESPDYRRAADRRCGS
jgi:beta-glucosidase